MSDPFHDTVRLPSEKREEILDALDEAAAGDRAAEAATRRRAERFGFRLPSAAVLLEHPGAKEASRYLVSTRNISSGGLSFLHGGFLYNSARCRIVLEAYGGEKQVVSGAVVNCRHVAGTLHEIGVRFDHEIDVRRFVDPRRLAPQTVRPEPYVPRNLAGRLLVVEPAEAVCRIIERDLGQERFDTVVVTYFGAAMDSVRRGDFDLILCECNVEGVMAEEALSRFRRAGYAGPVVFTTGSGVPDLAARLRALGASALLLKPFSQKSLVDTLGAALEAARHAEPGGAPPRPVDSVERDSALVDSMFGEIGRLIGDLERSVVERDLASLRRACEDMLASGERAGAGRLVEAARLALAAIEREPASAEALDAARTLAALAERLPRPGAPGRERGSPPPPRQQ